MRNILYTIAICLFLTTSCTFEVSDNGDLDGYWQLSAVDTLSNQQCVNMRDSGIFWAIQYEKLVARSVNPIGEVIFNFQKTTDLLILSNPYILYRDSSDIKITNPDVLRKYGVNNIEEQFRIVSLDDSRMILETDMLRLNFRKY